LALFCKKEHMSTTDAVRRALVKFVAKEKTVNGLNAFGVWEKRRVGGRTFVNELRHGRQK